MSPDAAAQQLASLAQIPAGDWAISRGGLVFSYAAYWTMDVPRAVAQ